MDGATALALSFPCLRSCVKPIILLKMEKRNRNIKKKIEKNTKRNIPYEKITRNFRLIRKD